MPAIFISYSGLDRPIASEIKTWLKQFGFERLFLDFDKETGFEAGANWEKRLYEELSRCHAVIPVVTPNWLESKWCFAELTQARALGKVILPVVCKPVGERFVLPDIQSVDLLNWNADGLDKLERRLRAITNELARGFKLDPNRPPFPGIHAFEAEDAAIYFGRDDETRAVIERLDARRTQGGARFLVVIGASGSGKSSLLKAGVLPQLSGRSREWVVLPYIRPEKAPVEALAKSIAQQIGRPDDWPVWHTTLGGAAAIDHVEKLLRDFRVGPARGATALLPIDQFEEVFTVATPAERATFLHLLGSVVDPTRDLSVMVIATGRSDVLDGLLEAGELAHLTETYALVPMPLDRVSRLVEGPAQVAALNVEKGLGEAIARDVESPEALPLLAHTLRLLYQRRSDNTKLSLAEYHSLGDPERHLNPIQNSVRLVADQAIIGLKPAESELAALRDAFVLHLVRVRLDDGKRVRQPAGLSELPRESLRLIHALVKARLLSTRTTDETDGPAKDGGKAVVEVAHEALFDAWPTLNQWLTEEHAFLADIERIKSAHDIWTQAPDAQKPSALLRGLLLSRARDWLLKYPQRFLSRDMTVLRAFVAAGADAEDAEKARIAAQAARTRRIERLILWGAIAAALVFAATALFARWQYFAADRAKREAVAERNEAQLRQSLLLVNLSQQADPGTAILLALEALPDTAAEVTRPYVPEAELRLDSALPALRERLVLKGHPTAPVRSAAFSSDGKRIVTASRDSTVQLWDAESGKPIGAPLPGFTTSLGSVAFSSDGKRIVTATSDNMVRQWDVESGKPIGEPLKGHTGAVNSAAFSPDGKRIVTASMDTTARLWEAESGRQIGEPLTGHTRNVNSAAFSPDGKRIVTTSDDYTVRLWNAESGRQIGDIAMDILDVVTSAVFSPDGKRIVTTYADNTPRLWDAENGKRIGKMLRGAVPNISAAFSPDGKRIATMGFDNTVLLWDAETGGPIGKPLKGHTASVLSAAFSPDGKLIVTASEDHSVQLWYAESGAPIGTPLMGHMDRVSSAAFSPDGTRIVTASRDDTVRLWDAESREQIGRLALGETYSVRSAAFSPDGTRIVTASRDNTVQLWDTESRKQIGEVLLDKGDSVRRAAFSPDGKRIVTASYDYPVRLWDIESGKPIDDSFTARASSAAFSPDGKRIVFASDDYPARLWDVESGRQIGQLLSRDMHGLLSAALSPDGKRIVIIAPSGAVRVLRVLVGTEETVKVAKTTLPRCLTTDQRRQFFLPAEPPAWCIEQEKWPYDTSAWKEWLSDVRAGKRPPLPAP